jgi:hypothetical protein
MFVCSLFAAHYMKRCEVYPVTENITVIYVLEVLRPKILYAFLISLLRLPHFLDNQPTDGGNVKVKLSLQQAVEAQRVVRRRGSHIF